MPPPPETCARQLLQTDTIRGAEQMMSFIRKILRRRAMEQGKSEALWRKICRPSTVEWTEYLRRHGGFRSFGKDCFISMESTFTDPHFTSIGNNVRIAGAWISGHDGSVNMLNRAYGKKLDAVGAVFIHDNVFVGRGATILPGVTIGPNAIVGAGSVIAKDIPPNSVFAGNPVKFIRTLDEHVEIIEARTKAYPWYPLIERRGDSYDAEIEQELTRQREQYFYHEDKAASAS